MSIQRKISPLLIITLASCMHLVSCSAPQTQKNADKPFSIKQENGFLTDPLGALPEKVDNSENIRLLGIDREEQIGVKIEHKLPKNLPATLQNFSIVPAVLKEHTIETLSVNERETKRLAEIKAWQIWLSKFHGYLKDSIPEFRKKSLKAARKAFKEELRALIKIHFNGLLHNRYDSDDLAWDQIVEETDDNEFAWHKTIREGRKDWQQIKQLVNDFRLAQKERREHFRQIQAELEIGYPMALLRIEEDVNLMYGITPFKTQAVSTNENNPLVKVISQGVRDSFAAGYGPIAWLFYESDIVKSAADALGRFFTGTPAPAPVIAPPPSNSPVLNYKDFLVNDPNSSTLTATNLYKEIITPDVGNQKTSQIEMFNRISAFAQKVKGAKTLNLGIRAYDIFKSLNFEIAQADKDRLQNCQSQIYSGTQLPSNCDFAFTNLINSFPVFDPRDVENTPPPWWSNNAPTTNDQTSFVFTLNFSPTNQLSAEHWLRKNLELFFPNSANIPSNQTRISEFLSKFNRFYFEAISPQVCEQGTNLEVNTANVASMQVQANGKSLLFDGEYQFVLGYYANIDGREDKRPLVTVRASDLAMQLDTAAHQMQDRREQPLTLADVQSIFPENLLVNVKNKTGNLWDLWIEKVGDQSCKDPVYSANCFDASDAVLTVDTRVFEAGVYRVRSWFSEAKYPPRQVPKVPAPDLEKFPVGYPVYGKNVSFGASDDTEYRFLTANGDFSTFARLSAYPEQITLYSDFVPSLTPTVLRSFGDDAADNMLHTYLLNLNPVPTPSAMPVPQNVPQAVSDIPGSKTISRAIQSIRQRFNGSASKFVSYDRTNGDSPSSLLTLKANLVLDLARDQSGNGSGSAFSAFRALNVPSDLGKQFVNVGAVVDLSNKNYLLNHQLLDAVNRKGFAPLLLQIKKGGNVVAKWPFDARLGSQTIVQRFWDGKTLAPMNQPAQQQPAYSQGEYQVEVIADPDRLNQAYYGSQRVVYGGAYIKPPSLGESSSSRVSINVPKGQVPTPTPNPFPSSGPVCKNPICDTYTQEDVEDLFERARELAEFYGESTGDKSFAKSFKTLDKGFNTKAVPGSSELGLLLSGYNDELYKMQLAYETLIRSAKEKLDEDLIPRHEEVLLKLSQLQIQKEQILSTIPLKTRDLANINLKIIAAENQLDILNDELEAANATLVAYEEALDVILEDFNYSKKLLACLTGDCYPETGSGPPNNEVPGCLTKINQNSILELKDKQGHVLKTYETSQSAFYYSGHGVEEQPDPMAIFQDVSQIGPLTAPCFKPAAKGPVKIRTNIQWMRIGYSPCDPSNKKDSSGKGYVTELHHVDQEPRGPIVEVSSAFHDKIYHRFITSRIERYSFGQLTARYWRLRAKQFDKGYNSIACK